MNRALLACAVIAAALLPGPPAGAAAPTIRGSDCGFVSMPVPTDPEARVAVINGGPIAVADFADLAANPVEVTLTCTIQAGFDLRHAAPDSASASGSGVVVAAVPPTSATYRVPDSLPEYVCTQVSLRDARGVTHTLYWDDVAGEYSTSPLVACHSVCLGCTPPNPFEVFVDPLACPAFGLLAPGVPGVLDVEPEGDLHLAGEWIWDCPPYWS